MIINENPQFDQENKIDNLIASLKVNNIKKNEETEIEEVSASNQSEISDNGFCFAIERFS